MIIAEGFDEYNDHFSVKVLDEKLNVSEIREQGNFKLISDHFRICPLDGLKDENDVDIILIVTSELILDWDDSRMAFWGKADTENGAALMTTHYWNRITPQNRTIWHHLAVHEVLHLLGYTHNMWDKDGVMQYAVNKEETDLTPYYDFQLPVRTSLFSTFSGHSFRSAVVFMNLAISFLMLPMVLSQELVVNLLHKKLSKIHSPPKWLSPLSVIGCFFLLMVVTGSFVALIFTLMFSILVHTTFHYLTLKKEKNS